LALKRLSWNEETAEVSYAARPTRRSGPRPTTASWDVLEFIARVVDHIPEPSQQMTRYWGWYANAARAIRRSLKLPAQEPEPLAHGPPHELELLDQIA
ncbi:MAG: transposase, partial [Thermoanaerobaculia bacterium]